MDHEQLVEALKSRRGAARGGGQARQGARQGAVRGWVCVRAAAARGGWLVDHQWRGSEAAQGREGGERLRGGGCTASTSTHMLGHVPPSSPTHSKKHISKSHDCKYQRLASAAHMCLHTLRRAPPLSAPPPRTKAIAEAAFWASVAARLGQALRAGRLAPAVAPLLSEMGQELAGLVAEPAQVGRAGGGVEGGVGWAGQLFGVGVADGDGDDQGVGTMHDTCRSRRRRAVVARAGAGGGARSVQAGVAARDDDGVRVLAPMQAPFFLGQGLCTAPCSVLLPGW